MQIHTPTVTWYDGGTGGWTPLAFLICCSNSQTFYFQWKAFDLLYKLRNILLVVALLKGL